MAGTTNLVGVLLLVFEGFLHLNVLGSFSAFAAPVVYLSVKPDPCFTLLRCWLQFLLVMVGITYQLL